MMVLAVLVPGGAGPVHAADPPSLPRVAGIVVGPDSRAAIFADDTAGGWTVLREGRRALLLSPDHAVLADGVLIPVKYLADGTTIRQLPATTVTYYHIELDRQTRCWREGLPVESYLDTGARSALGGSPARALAPDVAARVREARGCAAVRLVGPEVEAVRARLEARRVRAESIARREGECRLALQPTGGPTPGIKAKLLCGSTQSR